MIILHKWNYDKHAYDECELPDGRYCTVAFNMDDTVNCPHCFKEFTYGEGYTSLEFHTLPYGMGYAVCGDCHKLEVIRRLNDEFAENG